ncbi:MAG: hypothetical protein WC781_01160 [Candidatus Pacearchaeota archaeon]|jgi:hypothetical protein
MARNYIKINKGNKKFSDLIKELYGGVWTGSLKLERYHKILDKEVKILEEKIKKRDKCKYKNNLDNLNHNLEILEENMIIQESHLEPNYPKSICSIVYLAEGIEDLEKKLYNHNFSLPVCQSLII